ncbi:MAG: malonate transporter subunit MadL [Saprospiraceae bacterium]|nr:malonate transporter subunit MadL [Saprospiraceae bacterium]
MTIYGVALLAGCYLAGQILGELLGESMGIEANVGGVGFAMLLLIFLHDFSSKKAPLATETERGITFWSNMYIPVIVAMSATQNVRIALSSGWVALLAGIVPVLVCFAAIPVLAAFSKNKKAA